MRQKRRIISIGLAALIFVSLCAVCAGTGVTAATTSGGSQASSQAKLTSIVGAPSLVLDSAPAVCSWGAGRLDVFAKGTDQNLKHTWWDGYWHSWENLGAPYGGRLHSAPTAVSWGAGRIDVFAAGYDGELVHKWFDVQSGWHDWENLGAPPNQVIRGGTAPAACSWGANRVDIFVAGLGGQLWQKWFDNGWHDWYPLGKPSLGFGASPGAVSTTSWGYPRIDIFVRGYDGTLWQKWFGYGDWQAWNRFGDTAGLLAVDPATASGGSWKFGYDSYAPAVCSWGANRLDVFFVDTSGHLQQKWFDGNWQPLYQVGGTKFLTASPSAVVWQSSFVVGFPRLDIFTRGDDFALWQLYFAGRWFVCPNNGLLVPCFIGGWNGWYNLGTI